MVKLSRSTAHVILTPSLASLALCALRLGLLDTDGRRLGVERADVPKTAHIWERTGDLVEDGCAFYRREVRRA